MTKTAFLPLLVLALACNVAPKADYVLFSGKITNPTGENVIVSRDGFEQSMALSENGEWSDTLRLEPGYYRFSDGNEYASIYLSPGFVLSMELNTEEFDESIKYSGAGSEINNYVAAKYLLNESSLEMDEFFQVNEEEAQKELDRLSSELNALLDEAPNLPEDFVLMEKRNILYMVEGNKPYYAYYHKRYEEGYEASDEFLSSLDDIDYDNEADYTNLDSYRFLVQDYHANKMDELESLGEKVAYVQSIQNPKVKKGQAKALTYKMEPGDPDNQLVVELINEVEENQDFKDRISQKAEAMAKIGPGEVSPTFSYPNTNGEIVSLEDLKGQYVYIDVWATWCGPCKREIPHLKALEEEYSDKNIAFVGVSIDEAEDKEKWMDFVIGNELVGIQILADSDWESKWVRDYAIYSIPRFILLDTEGNIIDAMAPRPSEKDALVGLFNEYNI